MNETELLELIDRAARENATSLDLSGKKIQTIPPEIANLTNLRASSFRYPNYRDSRRDRPKTSNFTYQDLYFMLYDQDSFKHIYVTF
jgi:Leucine-rich repeat (LRR) protein